jgi:hypothetical protein
MSASSTSSATVNRWSSDRRFYTWVAIGAAFVIFVGFAQTYYLKLLFGTPPLRPLLHLHGLVMSAWFVLFFVQVRLVAVHRTDLHRRLGVAGAILAGLAVMVGARVAVVQGHLHLIHNDVSVEPPLALLPVTLGTLLLFASFVTAAILLRRRPDYHKRLMVLACVSILLPGIDRLPLHFIETAERSVLFGINDAFFAICIAYDTFKNRRLHPAWVWGGALVAVIQSLTLLISHTPAWTRIAEWILK